MDMKKRVATIIEEGLVSVRASADLPDIPDSMGDDLVSLAHASRDILGYDILHKAVVQQEYRLANILIALGITVLSPEKVLEYQSKLGRPNRNLVSLIQNAGGVLHGPFDEDNDEEESSFAEDESSSAEDDDDRDEPVKGSISNKVWERVPIEEYSKPIPAHVLLKAVEIKKALPSVVFMVEELRQMPDPFLIVTLRGEEFYIEVWEELLFEKRKAPKRNSR